MALKNGSHHHAAGVVAAEASGRVNNSTRKIPRPSPTTQALPRPLLPRALRHAKLVVENQPEDNDVLSAVMQIQLGLELLTEDAKLIRNRLYELIDGAKQLGVDLANLNCTLQGK